MGFFDWLGSIFNDPEPPAQADYTPFIKEAAEASARSQKLQEDQFKWAQEAYEDNKLTTDKIVTSFLDTQATTKTNAAKDRLRYEQKYQPVEDQLIADAAEYASPAREMKDRARAVAGVAQQADAARQNALQNLEGFGINPGSARYAALDRGTRLQQAAAQAGASEQAGQQTQAIGRALRSEAINIGKGYPGQIAGTYNTALQSGQTAGNLGLATTASGASTMGTGVQYGGLGINALNTGISGVGGYNRDALASFKADQETSAPIWGILGAAAGLGTKMYGFGAEGGVMDNPEATPGGAIPTGSSPSGGRETDDVSARLTAGEFVVPKDVAEWLGEKHLQNMITKAREDKGEARAKPVVKQAIETPPTFYSRPGMAIPVPPR